jgi:two-component system nitrogen regulation response regulator NtrX
MRAQPAFGAAEANGEPRVALLYVPAGPGGRAPVLARLLQTGIPMATATDASHALRLLASRPVTLALVDLAGDRTTLAAIRAIRAKHPQVSVAAVVDPANPLIAGEAIHAGVLDLIPWPFEDRDLLTVLSNARDLVVMDPADRAEALKHAGDRLVAQSAAMRSVLERAHAAANARTGLFVSGEPGTGRTLVARLVHRLGAGVAEGLAAPPFIAEDCADRTPDDIERRLFGVAVEGRKNGGKSAAFDRVGRAGAIYRARGGTLYLKNLLDAPARVQTRLVRLLRDREAELAEQAGTLVDLDVRLVACVDPSVDEAVGDGRMRADLYERLAHVRIDVPPLRRRREDIPVLAVLFLKRACDAQSVALKGISRSALKLLAALPWSGNATELRTLVDTLVRSVDEPVIQLDDLLEHASFETAAVRMDAGVSLRDAKARFERECISAVLARHHGRVGDAAKALGIQRTNLYRKVRQLQVVRPRPARRTQR